MPRPIEIKEVVKEVIQHLTSGDNVNKQDIVCAVNRVLDKKTLRHTKVESFKGNTLTIGVDSSAWLYKLTLDKTKLLNRLNTALPGAEIKKLLFKISHV